MRRLLHINLAAAFLMLIASCSKTIETVPPPAYDPLVGNWYIYDATEYDGRTWFSFDPALYGTFSFYPNGGAQYEDGNLLLQGNWSTADSYDAYYDYNGNYRGGLHQTFMVYVDGAGNHSVNLYFDDINFNGSNQFFATYNTGKGIQVFTFRRSN